jgi:hypothetical protein
MEPDIERLLPLFSEILLPRWVIVQKRNRMVKAEHIALIALTIIAACSGPVKSVKNLAIS